MCPDMAVERHGHPDDRLGPIHDCDFHIATSRHGVCHILMTMATTISCKTISITFLDKHWLEGKAYVPKVAPPFSRMMWSSLWTNFDENSISNGMSRAWIVYFSVGFDRGHVGGTSEHKSYVSICSLDNLLIMFSYSLLRVEAASMLRSPIKNTPYIDMKLAPSLLMCEALMGNSTHSWLFHVVYQDKAVNGL